MKKGMVTSKFISILGHILLVIIVIGMAIFSNLKIQDTSLIKHKKLNYDLAMAYDTALYQPHKLHLKYFLPKNYNSEKTKECIIETVHEDEEGKSKLSYYCTKSNTELLFETKEGEIKIEKR